MVSVVFRDWHSVIRVEGCTWEFKWNRIRGKYRKFGNIVIRML